MLPLLDEDKHAEHALKGRKKSKRGEKGKWARVMRVMRLAGRCGSSRYCGCGKCGEVPNGSLLNNGWIVVEKASAPWFGKTSYGPMALGVLPLWDFQ